MPAIQPASVPDNPGAAIALISELKANAALFAGFAFGAFALPGTLTVSESRVASIGSSISTSRPIGDSTLLQAFVVLDVSTLALMLICVAVSQLLIYRLSDGSYGSISYSTPERGLDRRDTALGRLVLQYGLEFKTARISFALGVATLAVGTGVKAWAIYDQSIALPVTAVLVTAASIILFFYLRSNAVVFSRFSAGADAAAGEQGGNGVGIGGNILSVLLPLGAAAAIAALSTGDMTSSVPSPTSVTSSSNSNAAQGAGAGAGD